MATLAIVGHRTRGREVIQLLEMLGGKFNGNLSGYNDDLYYYIAKDGLIYCSDIEYEELNCKYTIFTLEEFLEKFPYKIGDKVKAWVSNNIIYCGTYQIKPIVSMQWDETYDEVSYKIKGYDKKFYKERLKPYKEEGVNLQKMERKLDEALAKETTESLNKWLDEEPEPKAPILSNRYDYAEGKCGYVIPDGYEFDTIKEGFQTEIILKPKKPQYPKNYEECCGVLGYEPDEDEISCYQGHLIESFVKLLICRDAYWKMGLGKSWKPDWRNYEEQKYCIRTDKGKITLSEAVTGNKILAFPTPEMRDVFYENFKDLINETKELL